MNKETRCPVESRHQLHAIADEMTDVRGVICIHSTVLGPAAGGCRLWRYESLDDLSIDAVRLARGMSYKNALAGLPFGGGKAVIQHPAGEFDREALFRVFADVVAELDGRYITAEDVGTTVADMEVVRRRTPFVAGLDRAPGLAGGDPSPWTALGVFQSMQAAAHFALGCDVRDLTIAIQGLGNVGRGLCRLLREAGANLVVADVDVERAKAAGDALGATVIAPDAIVSADVDILAPCALGGVLNERSIPTLKAKIVCGGANNQLATDADGFALMDRGITYAPDYLVNAGGIINVAAEYLGETADQVRQRIDLIPERLTHVLCIAGENDQPTQRVADAIAEDIINAGETRRSAQEGLM